MNGIPDEAQGPAPVCPLHPEGCPPRDQNRFAKALQEQQAKPKSKVRQNREAASLDFWARLQKAALLKYGR